MFKREAIILAGGLGTRLKDVTGEIPKSMAPVNEKPFLVYLLDQLCRFRFTRTVLAVGYRYEDIVSFFGNKYGKMDLEYSVETNPLGTGGAILKASQLVRSESFLVLNGDTLFNIDLEDFRRSFNHSNSSLSIALKPMRNFERYGSVTMEEERIRRFNEKKFCEEGLINGGIYIMRKEWILSNAPSEKFSFEKDLMERKTTFDLITGYISDAYFIDIGVPDDYERAKTEIPVLFR